MKWCGMVSRLPVVGWTSHTPFALTPPHGCSFLTSNLVLSPLHTPCPVLPCLALSWPVLACPLQEFLLVRPTKENLELYESWIRSPTQSQEFFGDLADTCYRSVCSAVAASVSAAPLVALGKRLGYTRRRWRQRVSHRSCRSCMGSFLSDGEALRIPMMFVFVLLPEGLIQPHLRGLQQDSTFSQSMKVVKVGPMRERQSHAGFLRLDRGAACISAPASLV